MKQNTKNILALLLCLNIWQHALHASSLHTTCAKLVYYGSAFMYWNLLLGPTFDSSGGQLTLAIARHHINAKTPDLKDAAPESYERINNLLQQEGLCVLDNYTIKKGYDGLTTEWTNFGNKTLLIPHAEFVPVACKTSDIKDPLYTVADCEKAAAILGHEMMHSTKSHIGKRALLTATATISTIIFANKIGNRYLFNALSQGSYPTIMQSLLRMPLAFCAILPVYYLKAWYSRKTEREADNALKNSSKLASKFSEHIKKEQLPHDKAFEESLPLMWDKSNVDHPMSLTNKLLTTILSKNHFVAFKKYNANLLDSHPPAEERIAYLEEWACQPQSKDKIHE